MSRRGKTGLDYFPLDVDFFEDTKIGLIESEFGVKGPIVAIKLLCKIYRNGYYYHWGHDECMLFARNDMGGELELNAVNEVVKGLVRRRFFDERCFNSFQILTSSGIQRRFLEASGRRQKVDLVEEYRLVEISKEINVNILRLNADIKSDNTSIETQSKVEYSRENNKENNKEKVASIDAPTPKKLNESFNDRMSQFRMDLAIWEETYGVKNVEAFFVYWSEPNKSRTKMKWEMQKTWDLPRRLNTWYERSKTFSAPKLSFNKSLNFASYDNSAKVERF